MRLDDGHSGEWDDEEAAQLDDAAIGIAIESGKP